MGNWFTSLFPQWKLIPSGIPNIGKLILRAISTFGHWLQVWFPSVEINSYNYFQTFLQEIDLFLIDFEENQIKTLLFFSYFHDDDFFKIDVTFVNIYEFISNIFFKIVVNDLIHNLSIRIVSSLRLLRRPRSWREY